MLTIVYISLILLGCVFEWPKGSKVFDCIVIITLSYAVGSCTTHADYASYSMQYLTSAPTLNVFDEPLWKALMCLFRSFGFSYNWFIALLTFIFMTLFLLGLRMLNLSTPFVWAMLLIYPGLMGLVQIRQLFAMIIAFLAFAYLLTAQKGRLFGYCCLVLIAGMVHVTAYFLLLVPFLKVFSRYKMILCVFVVALLISAFFSDWMLNLSQRLFVDDVSQAYLAGYGGVTNELSRFFTVFEVIGTLLLLIVSRGAGASGKYDRAAYEYLLPINLLFIAVIPLLMLNTDFLRLNRYVLLLNLIVLGSLSPLENDAPSYSGNAKRIALRFAAVSFYGILFYCLVWMQAPDTVVGAILQW